MQTKVPDSLPPSVFLALTVITVLASAWPSIHDVFLTTIPWRRRQARAKTELELMKMRYEIEAFKKDHHLETLPEEASFSLSDVDFVKPVIPAPTPKPPLKRFAYGFLGGLASFLVYLAGARANPLASVLLGVSFGAVLSLAAGVWTLLFTRRTSSLRTCFFTGAFAILLLFTIHAATKLHI